MENAERPARSDTATMSKEQLSTCPRARWTDGAVQCTASPLKQLFITGGRVGPEFRIDMNSGGK